MAQIAHLMKLELKKNHIGKYILIVILSILASMFFVFVALHDSSESADTFTHTFRVIEMIFVFVFVILFSVLNASIIINEYNNKTILILFSYPVDRGKVILSKLILITLFVAISMMVGYVFCCSFVVGMDECFDWIEGEFQLSTLRHWVYRAITTIIVFCNLGLWTFAVGMWKKSVPMTIVSSMIFIFIRQIVVASTDAYQENIWFILIAFAITLLALWYTFGNKVEELDG